MRWRRVGGEGTRARARVDVVDSKSRPHRLRIHAEKIADIDEIKRPVAPLGSDPFESIRGLSVRHAGAASLNATHGVLEYCRDERYLRAAHPGSVGREVRGENDAIIGDRGIIARGLIRVYRLLLVSEHSVTSGVEPSSSNIRVTHEAARGR